MSESQLNRKYQIADEAAAAAFDAIAEGAREALAEAISTNLYEDGADALDLIDIEEVDAIVQAQSQPIIECILPSAFVATIFQILPEPERQPLSFREVLELADSVNYPLQPQQLETILNQLIALNVIEKVEPHPEDIAIELLAQLDDTAEDYADQLEQLIFSIQDDTDIEVLAYLILELEDASS